MEQTGGVKEQAEGVNEQTGGVKEQARGVKEQVGAGRRS